MSPRSVWTVNSTGSPSCADAEGVIVTVAWAGVAKTANAARAVNRERRTIRRRKVATRAPCGARVDPESALAADLLAHGLRVVLRGLRGLLAVLLCGLL